MGRHALHARASERGEEQGGAHDDGGHHSRVDQRHFMLDDSPRIQRPSPSRRQSCALGPSSPPREPPLGHSASFMGGVKILT